MPTIHHLPFLALLLIPLLAFCDREIGDGEGGLVKRSMAFLIALIVAGALGVLAISPAFIALGLTWGAWRTIPFKNGSGCPQSGGQVIAAAVRQLLIVPLALMAYYFGGDWHALALFLTAAAGVNLVMRIRYGQIVADLVRQGLPMTGDFNRTVEVVSGLAVGAAFAGYAFWTAAGLRLLPS